MSRWVRSGMALTVIAVLVAALAATVTIHTAGLGRADVCADPGGQQFEAVGACTEPGAAAPLGLPSPDYVAPLGEFVSPSFPLPPPIPITPRRDVGPPLRPENFRHPANVPPVWTTADPMRPGQQLPSGPFFGGRYEVGTYMSDNLQIYGLICYPLSLAPRPVLILNPGYGGITTPWSTACFNLAANGWLVATSAYRGQPIGPLPAIAMTTFTATSPGKFEFCGGEVDDVLNLLAAVKALPNNVANPSQVVMYGHSLGSCSTELAIERLGREGGAAPQIAVSLDGPTDFTHVTWQQLGVAWCDSCGPGGPGPGTPAQQQQQLTARSSAYDLYPLDYLANPNLKFLRIHDTGDGIVAPQMGCQLAAALGPGSSNYYYHLSTWTVEVDPKTGQPVKGYPAMDAPGTYASPPKTCAPWPMPWKNGQPTPDQYTPAAVWNTPTFLLYSCPYNPSIANWGCPPPGTPTGIEHADIVAQSWPEVASFVNQFASGWGATFPSQFPFM